MGGAIEILKQYTNHQNLELVNSGKAAIFAAFAIARKINPKAFILLPEDGAPSVAETYAKMLRFDVKYLRTKDAHLEFSDVQKHAATGAAIYVPSFGAGTVEHNLFELSRICKQAKCLLIEDASLSIGDKKLCNGDYSDIIIANFGKSCIINLGHGGCISVKYGDYLDKIRPVLEMMTCSIDHETLQRKVEAAPIQLHRLLERANLIKAQLHESSVLHPSSSGVTVLVSFDSPKEKQKIVEYCEKYKYPYLECPHEQRISKQAISIEMKH